MDRNMNHCKVQREQHSQLVMSRINSLWKANELTDVTLLTQDGAMIQAHKVVLAASSDYFRKIFQQCPAQNPIIVCGGKHFEQMESIVKFIYQGENNLRENNLQGFRQACQEFQIHLPDHIKYHPIPRTVQHQKKHFDDSYASIAAKINASINGSNASTSSVPPPPLKKRKIMKPEYNVPSQLQQLLQQLPGIATAASIRKESSPSRDSPLNLSLLESTNKKESMTTASKSLPVKQQWVTKISGPRASVEIKEGESSQPNSIPHGDADEKMQGQETNIRNENADEGSVSHGVVAKSAENVSDVESCGTERITEMEVNTTVSSEDQDRTTTDAENLKKALDNFTAKLSTARETDEDGTAGQEATNQVSRKIKLENVENNDGTKTDDQEVAEPVSSQLSESQEQETSQKDVDANSSERDENDATAEVSESDDSSELSSDSQTNSDVYSPPDLKENSARKSQNATSVSSVVKNQPKQISLKPNSYPSIHQQQQYSNYPSPYDFDADRFLVSNYQNHFMNPNLTSLLDPNQLLAQLSSSITAQSKSQQQRPKRPILQTKPVKLVTKKPPIKRVDGTYQWPPKRINSSSVPSAASTNVAGSSKTSSSQNQPQQYNLLRTLLAQSTPSKAKPCTVTSSSASNQYTVSDFSLSQYPTSSSSNNSWYNANSTANQKAIQKARLKSANSKRSTQYTCSVCSREFIYFKAYQEHLNSHISAIHCPGCTKTFASRGFLERHLDSGKCSLKKK